MGSLIISSSEINNMCSAISASLKYVESQLQSINTSVQTFTQDTTQKGTSWDNLRSHLSDYQLIITALETACEAISADCDSFSSGVSSGISPDSYLNEIQLRQTIESLKSINSEYADLVDDWKQSLDYETSKEWDDRDFDYESDLRDFISDYNGFIEDNEAQIQELEGKIQKMYDTESATCSLFQSCGRLFQAAISGMESVSGAFTTDRLGRPYFTITNNADWKEKLYAAYVAVYLSPEDLEKYRENGWTDKEIYNLFNDPYVIGCEDTTALYEFLEALLEETFAESSWDTASNFADYIANLLEDQKAFDLLFRDGVLFKLTKSPDGKYLIKMSGEVVTGRTRAELIEYLKKNISSVNWDKYHTKQLTRDGLGIRAQEWEKSSFDDLYEQITLTRDALSNGKNVRLYVAGQLALSQYRDAWKSHIDNFKWTAETTGIQKVAKGLGVVSDAYTIFTDFKDNMYENGELTVNGHSVTESILDVGIDFGVDATTAAAGAAIGSCFMPPLGTAVGAVAGVACSVAANWDVADIDGDGEKDSLVDMAKIGADRFCDLLFGDD